ncbi:hypothetical protein [Breoghania sp.]|uniref:hypothetical protein n=1 Tax=Breoghania sp. TaxID=2065378 RepID=UPI0029CA15BF|nr:hypothetical protein [Breoghania sp.]
MTSRLNEFRRAMETMFQTAMPTLKECKAQLGRFDLEELERNSIKAPALRCAVLRAPLEANPDDTSSARLACAAFAICDGRNMDDDAWMVAEAAAALLRRNQRFGLSDIGAPIDIRIAPVLSANFNRRGVAIVATEWTQVLHGIGASMFDGELPIELTFSVNGDDVILPEDAGSAA